MGKVFLRFAFLASVSVALCGCETVFSMLFGNSEQDDPAASAATWWDGVPRIRCGVGMVIQMSMIGQQPIKMDVQVDQQGQVTLPYLLQEPVLCDGLTLDAFRQKLVKAYQVYIKQPQITVTFAPFDQNGVSPWGTVTVLGEVASPGPVNMPATMDLTVTKVLKAAGGLKPFADKSRIRVTSCDKDGNKKRTIINLPEIGKEGLIDKDISLRPGDVVWVPESWY